MRWWVGDSLGAKMATGVVPGQRCPLTPSPNTRLKGKEQQAAPWKAAMPPGGRWPTKEACEGDACHHRTLPPRLAALHALSWHPLGTTTVPVPITVPVPVPTAVAAETSPPFPPPPRPAQNGREFPTHATTSTRAQIPDRCSPKASAAQSQVSLTGQPEQLFPHLFSLSQDFPNKDSSGPPSGLCCL